MRTIDPNPAVQVTKNWAAGTKVQEPFVITGYGLVVR